jgi:hypothetical protein
MTKYSQHLTEDRRLVILRILAELPTYRANSSLICSLLSHWGHAPTRDQVKTDLTWLQEQGLLSVETLETVMLATLSERGADVVAGRAFVPGVKRPGAGA